ncbi:MAG: hypothetical protein ACR2JJ_06635 [Sphingomicrobium sp.]
MEDRDPDRVRDTERTTIIHTGGGGGGGGGGLLAVVVLILLAVLLFFLFAGDLGRDSGESDVNINVAVPETQLPAIDLPDVNVNVPDNDRGDGNTTNRSE